MFKALRTKQKKSENRVLHAFLKLFKFHWLCVIAQKSDFYVNIQICTPARTLTHVITCAYTHMNLK